MTYVAHAYTPRESASYGGSDHIVTETSWTIGRLTRHDGDALCKPRHKFWGLVRTDEGSRATCKRCLEIAARDEVASHLYGDPDGGADTPMVINGTTVGP